LMAKFTVLMGIFPKVLMSFGLIGP